VAASGQGAVVKQGEGRWGDREGACREAHRGAKPGRLALRFTGAGDARVGQGAEERCILAAHASDSWRREAEPASAAALGRVPRRGHMRHELGGGGGYARQ
jgi:hypothetical protein